jgi:hypothetical protein
MISPRANQVYKAVREQHGGKYHFFRFLKTRKQPKPILFPYRTIVQKIIREELLRNYQCLLTQNTRLQQLFQQQIQ